ncbi:MAG TPA: single-stranded-DNA-specific exonuclease RecJ [Patescibacteria group bacterium]|jgi:single-stranded-DNA-specific exonuclease|nr:single-stranded-DNA-specific exonuclease RecJ [Patescibacteria group bacterium]
MASAIFEQLLLSRGLADNGLRSAFLHPSYEELRHDPLLLPDMSQAVERLKKAKARNELIFIYGDYDIDGLTATTLLLDAFKSFGFRASAFIPNRFIDGYGLNKDAIKKLADDGAQVIVTVDCGSLSHEEIELASSLGVDVIVTDHHTVAETMPSAVAVINPKRADHKYPFVDLAGVGVAFKLVQALQLELDGLPIGQEKWLLDLVALGTVCDVVTLLDENRANVFWGLQVLQKTRRPGIKALAAVAGLELSDINARSLGYVLGPHLNASGRLETAQLSLDLLTASDPLVALNLAYKLRDMNLARRKDQARITKEAAEQAGQFRDDNVLVLSHTTWSHGIVGIVAAKMLETFKKPTFVLQEMGSESKGSARSFGDFSAVEAIRAVDQWLTKGGGHKLAAGVTLPTEHIPHFRQAINEFYKSLNLQNQAQTLQPQTDIVIDEFSSLTTGLVHDLDQLEPYGHGNQEAIFELRGTTVYDYRKMGQDNQHVKLHLKDSRGDVLTVVGFNQANQVDVEIGKVVTAWVHLLENEWRGTRTLEGRLLRVA